MKDSHHNVVGIRNSEKRESILISKNEYDAFAEFILDTIRSEKENKITLDVLLDKVRTRKDVVMHSGTYWTMLQVKMDLEAKGIIEVTVKYRKQYISLLK